MKVYELMNALSEHEAGSEVKFNVSFPFRDLEKFDDDEYCYDGNIKELHCDDNGDVILFN